MLTTFGTATYKVGLKVHPNEEDPRVPIMCWGSCAYTIQSIGKGWTDVPRSQTQACIGRSPVIFKVGKILHVKVATVRTDRTS